MPERLKVAVGKCEIKLSLRTRDPVIARIRSLELLANIERGFAGITVHRAMRGRPVSF
jgi:uncharacterized protein DUF6538